MLAILYLLCLYYNKCLPLNITVCLLCLNFSMQGFYLSRLGAQTIARFLTCMLVSSLKVARWARCFIRYSRVLRNTRVIVIDTNIGRQKESDWMQLISFVFFLGPIFMTSFLAKALGLNHYVIWHTNTLLHILNENIQAFKTFNT